jgi:hypothetical protein
MNVKKFNIDDIVFYRPFANDENIISEILKNISEKSVILKTYDNETNRYEYYDYEICILESGKIKKVKEDTLFKESN